MTATDTLSESDFTHQLRDIAHMFGYSRYHTWLAKHSPVGFPDEVLVRPPRIIFAELKRERAQPTPNQEAWLNVLAACGLEVYLWRPSMFDQIVNCLRPRERPRWPGPGIWSPS